MLHEETFNQTVDVPYNFLNINNKPCSNFAGIKCNICTDINGNNNKGYIVKIKFKLKLIFCLMKKNLPQ